MADLAAEAPAAEVQVVVGNFFIFMENFDRNENLSETRPTEKTEEEKAEEKEELEKLRSEISELVMVERRKKEASEHGYNSTLENINPENLTEEDLKIYKDFLDKKISTESFNKYNGALKAYLNNLLSYEENMKWFDPKEYKIIFEKKIEKEM